MSTPDLYMAMNVFRRLESGEVVVYRCFKKLPDQGYVVQSADRVRVPVQEHIVRQHEAQFWELLIEEAPEVRGGLFPTVEEAIAQFDRSFNDY